jgi:hypothetical protein
MTGQSPPESHGLNISENTKLLSLSGGFLFAMGFLAFFGGIMINEPTVEKINMALGASFFFAFGYPLLLYVNSLRKFRVLQDRLDELENRSKS